MCQLVNRHPPGYGRVAAIEDLDRDFLAFRKFGWLRNYALLQLQDELAELEAKIQEHDDWESKFGNESKLVSRRDDLMLSDGKSARKELVEKLHSKLEQYGRHEILCNTYRPLTLLRQCFDTITNCSSYEKTHKEITDQCLQSNH